MGVYQDTPKIANELNQYLDQRACWEENWLDALLYSEVPTTLVWGWKDTIAPKRVGDFLWALLEDRPNAKARYISSPEGGHYLTHDQPDLFACLIKDPKKSTCNMYNS